MECMLYSPSTVLELLSSGSALQAVHASPLKRADASRKLLQFVAGGSAGGGIGVNGTGGLVITSTLSSTSFLEIHCILSTAFAVEAVNIELT